MDEPSSRKRRLSMDQPAAVDDGAPQKKSSVAKEAKKDGGATSSSVWGWPAIMPKTHLQSNLLMGNQFFTVR